MNDNIIIIDDDDDDVDDNSSMQRSILPTCRLPLFFHCKMKRLGEEEVCLTFDLMENFSGQIDFCPISFQNTSESEPVEDVTDILKEDLLVSNEEIPIFFFKLLFTLNSNNLT